MASLRSSSSTSILSLATAFTSFIFVVDEGDAMAFVLPGPAVLSHNLLGHYSAAGSGPHRPRAQCAEQVIGWHAFL